MLVRLAVMDDVNQVKKIADAHVYELGFTFRPVYEQAVRDNSMLVAVDGTKIVGFTRFRFRKDNIVTRYQTCVVPEVRFLGVGTLLITALEAMAIAKGYEAIRLKCPIDLPANKFDEATGYTLIETIPGKNRDLNVWEKRLR